MSSPNHLSEKQIRLIYARGKKRDISGPAIKPEFDLESLVGEKIVGHRTIKTRSDNPQYLEVIDFTDKTLIIGVEGWEDGSTYHTYLVNNNNLDVRYTDRLFNAGLRDSNRNPQDNQQS